VKAIDGGDVIVVGAGLIGLSIAFELAERGAVVRVYDRGEPGRAASWAGAGMLAPHTEDVEDEALLTLGVTSLAQYPGYIERIRRASSLDPRLHLDGIVHVAYDGTQLERLTHFASRLNARGVGFDLLERSSLVACEPWLGHNVVGGLCVHGEGEVDNRRLGRALAAACIASGATIAHAASIAVECDQRRVLGIRTDVGFTAASAVVNACGAWAAQLAGVPPACVPPVEPVKGQMLALSVPIGFVRRPTWLPGAYLVPRDDGRLLVGATVERAGFDTGVTAEAIHSLLHETLTGAPSLAGFAVSESWAGLRPGTPDGRPFLGVTPVEGLLLATGHYRNGILLAPATARSIADLLEGKGADELGPLGLARLSTKAVHSRRTTAV
jgi:glycine oxidase